MAASRTACYNCNLGSKGPEVKTKPEAQLMLTNPYDAFRGQSRSTNMVPFDILGMVSY